uniref:Putative B3 domain-containing protein-like n=1 Tax=Solanum chacoense TaxID=4108 RepID=A0A0V0HJZ4_SOLCH
MFLPLYFIFCSYLTNFGILQHIPNEFVTEHGANLGDIVLLEVPNGVVWKIKLLNSSGMVWLNEGWNKFKEYYSIACGYFLLFRYKGNSQFSVFIFDLSASEIEYPPGPNEDMTPENRSVLCVPPEENRINLPPPGEPPKENRVNLTPPDDPPEEDVIYLPPPGIYTMEELSLSSMPSRPKV